MGRHSDSVDVTGPIGVTGPDKRPGKRRRLPYVVAAAASAVVVAIVLVVVLSGGSPDVTIRGNVSPGGGAFGGLAMSYSECSETSPSPGSQVTVSNPGGAVIGSATLGTWSPMTATADGVTMYACDMPFTIKNIPAESRYGFKINNVPGEIWVTSVRQSVTLEVGSGS